MKSFWKKFASLSIIIIPIEIAYYSNKIGKELWKAKLDCNPVRELRELRLKRELN